MEFHIAAPVVFNLGPFPVTNSIIAAWLAMIVLILLARAATSRMSIVPGRLQGMAELVVEQFLSIGETTADARRARQFLPFVATGFLFILVANWMGILPLYGEGELYVLKPAAAAHTTGEAAAGAPTGKPGGQAVEKPAGQTTAADHGEQGGAARDEAGGQTTEVNLLRSANSDLNIPLAMSLIAFLYWEWLGFSTGGLAYAKEFIWPGMLIEIISHIARPVALSLRLFGNILAGEILLTVVAGLVGIVIPAVFLAFELFVGIVQALIFALLCMAFLSMSTAHAAAHELAEHAGEGVAHH